MLRHLEQGEDCSRQLTSAFIILHLIQLPSLLTTLVFSRQIGLNLDLSSAITLGLSCSSTWLFVDDWIPHQGVGPYSTGWRSQELRRICRRRVRCICANKYLRVGNWCIAISQQVRLCGHREGRTTRTDYLVSRKQIRLIRQVPGCEWCTRIEAHWMQTPMPQRVSSEDRSWGQWPFIRCFRGSRDVRTCDSSVVPGSGTGMFCSQLLDLLGVWCLRTEGLTPSRKGIEIYGARVAFRCSVARTWITCTY